MTISNYAENALLDSVFNSTAFDVNALFMALHDGDPGETGAAEVAGGSYARQDVLASFAAASGGAVASNVAIEFALMPAVTVVACSFWDALTVGNCLWIGHLTGSSVIRGVFSAEADDDLFTCKAHGLSAGDAVVFTAEGLGVTLPTGVTAGVIYYVIASGLTTDVFKVSTTSGGSTINVTADGNGAFLRVVPKVVAAGDTLRFASGTVVASLY